MAYVWSWAFGPETGAELNDYSPWDITSPTPNGQAPSNSIKHSYTGDTANRYAMGVRGQNGYHLRSESINGGSGWFSAYIYYNGTDLWDAYNLFTIGSAESTRVITAEATTGGKSIKMKVEGTQVATSSFVFTDQTWHHIGIKYDMTVDDNWGMEIFVDGNSILSGSRNWTGLDPVSSAYISLGGVKNSVPPLNSIYWSDIIFYDDPLDSNPIGQFVSRIEPYLDQSATSGNWTPPANILKTPGDQAENLSGSISTSPVVSEADPTTGEFVRVLSQDLGTNIGLPSFGSFGFTGHLFASGSSATNVISKFAVGAPGPPGTFISGAPAIDGENAYAYASSGSTIYASGSTIYLQAEISGS